MRLERRCLGQLLLVKQEQRFRHRHVYVDGSTALASGKMESLVYQSATQPSFLFIMRLRQLHRPTHHWSERSLLRQRLSIELSYPLLRSVCRHHDERHMLIKSLSHSRCHVQERRPRGHTHHNRSPCGLRQANSIEPGRPFIGDRVTCYLLCLIEVMHNWRVAATRTHHGIGYAFDNKQRR